MELNDVLALVKAGYNREEISAMEQPQTTVPNTVSVVKPVTTPAQKPEPVQTPVVKPVTTPAQKPEPVQTPVAVPVAPPVPTQQPAQAQSEPTMAELMQSIAKLTSAVQANAIAQSVIPQGLSNPPSAEDMLAEIIRPTVHPKGD